MAMFPIIVVKEKRSSVGAEQVEGGALSVQIVWYDRSTKEIQHMELATHLRDVVGDTAVIQGMTARAVDGVYQIELGDEDIPSEFDLATKG